MPNKRGICPKGKTHNFNFSAGKLLTLQKRRKLQKVKNKEGFTRKFQRELILYEAAVKHLKGKNPPPLETLIKDNGDLSERKAKLYEEYKKLKSKSAEIEVIRSNVDTLLNRPKERNTEIEK